MVVKESRQVRLTAEQMDYLIYLAQSEFGGLHEEEDPEIQGVLEEDRQFAAKQLEHLIKEKTRLFGRQVSSKEKGGVKTSNITGIVLTRDNKFTAFCDTGVFQEGKCQFTIEQPEDCPHGKDICCLLCELFESESCDRCCDRINPDE